MDADVDAEPGAEVGVEEACSSAVASEEVPEAMSVPASTDESLVPPSFTLDRNPRDRSGDRMLARQGLLEDALPLFADHEALPRAGALLAALGLDRAPEVKTVRRKFTRLAQLGRGKPLMEAPAKRRIAEEAERVAFLYIDGQLARIELRRRRFDEEAAADKSGVR